MVNVTAAAAPAGRSPRGVIPARSSRGRLSLPGVARAYVERRLVAENISLPNKHKEELETRIRNQLRSPQLPPSSYDTAWVSMVPMRGSHQTPRFPQCVEWILQNQQDDGSWGVSQSGSSVSKDVL